MMSACSASSTGAVARARSAWSGPGHIPDCHRLGGCNVAELELAADPAGTATREIGETIQAKLGCLVWRRLLVSTHGERAYGDEAERHWGLQVPVLAGFGR